MMLTEKRSKIRDSYVEANRIQILFRFRNQTKEKETNNQPKQQQTNLFIMKPHHELKP